MPSPRTQPPSLLSFRCGCLASHRQAAQPRVHKKRLALCSSEKNFAVVITQDRRGVSQESRHRKPGGPLPKQENPRHGNVSPLFFPLFFSFVSALCFSPFVFPRAMATYGCRSPSDPSVVTTIRRALGDALDSPFKVVAPFR